MWPSTEPNRGRPDALDHPGARGDDDRRRDRAPDLTLEVAADVLAEHGIGAAPVVDDDGQLVGLLRDEDLLVSEARLHVPTIDRDPRREVHAAGLMRPLRRGAEEGRRRRPSAR